MEVFNISTKITNFIVLLLYLYGEGSANFIEIRGNIVGSVGSNGSELMCLFHNTPSQVALTFNNSSNIIVVFRNTGTSIITEQGQHLKGRVSLQGLTDLSNQTSVIFNELRCIDEGLYWCQIVPFADDGAFPTHLSENYTMNIKVPPVKPVMLNFHKDRRIQNTTDGDSTFIDVTETSNASLPLTFENDKTAGNDIIEGDKLTILCNGNIGRPAGELIIQVKLPNGNVDNLTADFMSISEQTDNCTSIYQNNTFTYNVTSSLNGGRLRCGEKSWIFHNDLAIETQQIEVKYPVRPPSIVADTTKQSEYIVLLYCDSLGNPTPDYFWYKVKASGETEIRFNITNNTYQNITIRGINESGVYYCRVSNSVDGFNYYKEESIVVRFEEKDITSNDGAKNTSDIRWDVLGLGLGIAPAGFIIVGLIFHAIKVKKCFQKVSNIAINLNDASPNREVKSAENLCCAASKTYESMNLDELSGKSDNKERSHIIDAQTFNTSDEDLDPQMHIYSKVKKNKSPYACVSRDNSGSVSMENSANNIYDYPAEDVYNTTSYKNRHQENRSDLYDSMEGILGET